MNSEVCPFCGKSYKRLKSHLPHCKAAPSAQTTRDKPDVTAEKTTTSPQPDTHLSRPTAKGKKSEQTSAVTAGVRAETEAATLASPSTSSSPPSTTKKRKQKLADQIRSASSVSPPAPPPPPPVTGPKAKKKSLRALIEAAKSNQGAKEAPDEDPPAFSPLTSVNAAQTENRTKQDEDSVVFSLANPKPKKASKEKVSKSKRDVLSLHATKQTSNSQDSKEGSRRPRDNFWVDSEGEKDESSLTDFLLKPGGGSRAKITLQDVKATLRRAKGARQSFKSSVLSHVETADILSGRTRPDGVLGPTTLPPEGRNEAVSGAVKTAALSVQLRSSQLQSVENNAPKSKQPSLILPHHKAAPAVPPSPAPVPSQTASPRRAAGPREELKVGRGVAGLLGRSTPLSQYSSPLYYPLPPQTLQLETTRQNTAENPTEAALARRGLGQVTLRELPEWLAIKTPSHPRDVVQMVQRGWQWYYRKYIDVKKGGVGGLGMLLAGYCVLSYIWAYPHIKLDRWRKYH